MTGPRHRLNPRGNRKLNHAIHIAAICQLRYPSEGRDLLRQKIAEGKTSKEAIRALKRRISDRVYRHLIADAKRRATSKLIGWVREDTQERLLVQRDRLNILKHRLFGQVTSRTQHQH